MKKKKPKNPARNVRANRGKPQTVFWEMMKWAVPIFLAIVVGLYIYMLTHLTGPIAQLQEKHENSCRHNESLEREMENLEQQLTENAKQIAGLNRDIEYLHKENATMWYNIRDDCPDSNGITQSSPSTD